MSSSNPFIFTSSKIYLKLLLLSASIVLTGVGCVSFERSADIGSRTADNQQQWTAVEFCTNMSSEIEGRAASLQVADELRPYVDAWQAIIMNHYGLSESEMGNMFLLADVIHFPKQSSGRMTVSIRYVVKAGDVYFKPLSLDFEARADEVGQMTGAQIKDYLIGKYVAQSLDAEDPTQQIIVMDGINLGLAKSAINQVSQKSCAQYATLLKSCDAVVKPIDFIIKPGLNKAWLSAGGRSGDQCYSATVDLFSSQVDCGRPTPCSI